MSEEEVEYEIVIEEEEEEEGEAIPANAVPTNPVPLHNNVSPTPNNNNITNNNNNTHSNLNSNTNNRTSVEKPKPAPENFQPYVAKIAPPKVSDEYKSKVFQTSKTKVLKLPKLDEGKPLTVDDIYQERQFKIDSYPTKERFFSLSNEQIDKIPWINYLTDKMTSNLIIPANYDPNVCKDIPMKCEEELTAREPDEEAQIKPKDFVAELNKNNIMDFQSNPFIDLNAKSCTNSITFPYIRQETRLGFFHLRSLTFDHNTQQRFDANIYINTFVYTDKPFTETAIIKISPENQCTMGSTLSNSDSLIFPYPLDGVSYLIMFILLEDEKMTLANGQPFAIGKFLLPTDKLPEKIEPEFIVYSPAMKLNEYLTSKSNFPIQFCVDAEMLTRPEPGKTLRLTAVNSLFPSPILTIHDISIEYQHKIITKKESICVSCALRKIPADPKSTEARGISAFMNLKTRQYSEIGYSSLIPFVEKIVVPEPFNFVLDPLIVEPIEVLITVYSVKKNKLKPVLVSKFQIKDTLQMHLLKMEPKGSILNDMKSALSKGGNSLRCSTIFPTLVVPPPSVKPCLYDFVPNIVMEPMFKNVSIYAINRSLLMKNLETTQFSSLFEYFRMSNMTEVQTWIEHFFTPEPGFTSIFMRKVMSSYDVIQDWPQPFFLLIFKAMCVEDQINEELLNMFFKSIIVCKIETIKKSAGDLLLQLPMFFNIKEAHRIAFRLINQCATIDRFFFFKYIFSDITYIQSLALFDIKIGDKPLSPFVPLLSLFFITVQNAFMENNAESVGAASFTLSILATTLEQYVDENSAKVMTKIIFPLLSIVFTFYDSLSVQLEKKNSLLPFLLFILKYCDPKQFLQYYTLLSIDNQLRFLDFLIILADTTMVDVAQITQYFNEHFLNCTYEITCRLLVFLSILIRHNASDESMMRTVFELLIHMLHSKNQSSESFRLILKSMADFVNLYLDHVYVKHTALINQIITAIVTLTQRKLAIARIESIGFILWLIEKELPFRKTVDRCNLALQYAVCNSLFQLSGNEYNDYYEFWTFLPDGFSVVPLLHRKLSEALTDKLTERQITKLLDIYMEFKNFPSIRGQIYSKIVELNVKSKNICSAFVAQWKLCALISEVFKLQKIVVPGIPKNGSKDFPFIVNEPSVDLSVYPEDSAFLVMESTIFTQKHINDSLQYALQLCQDAGVHWLIGDVTQYLFDYLEKQRQFSLLKTLYEKVNQSFIALQKDENPNFEFARIFVKGKSAEKLGFTDAIHAYPKDGRLEYIKTMFSVLEGVRNVDISGESAIPRFSSKLENDCQIVFCKYIPDELKRLSAKTFYVDVLSSNCKDWNDVMVSRYTFITEAPLPGCVPTVKVEKHTETTISMQNYYVEKLKDLRDNLLNTTESIKAVIPPPKMLQAWAQYVTGINATPILKQLSLVFEAKDDTPYYKLIKDIHENLVKQQLPEEVALLCDDIWDLMLSSVPVIKSLVDLGTLSPNEKTQYIDYRKKLGVPVVALTD